MAETSARGEGDGGKCDGFQDTNPILLNIMQNFNNSLIQFPTMVDTIFF